MIKDIEDIGFLVEQIAQRLDCAWARQSDYYRLEFADGLSLSAHKVYGDKLRISVMLGNMYRLLNYQEAAACAEFNTDRVSYIVPYIKNNILNQAREQFERVSRKHQELEAKERLRVEQAQAIAAQFGGEVRSLKGYDFFKSVELYQYSPREEDALPYSWTPSASYIVNHNSTVDLKAHITAKMAVWFAHIMAHPDLLDRLPELITG